MPAPEPSLIRAALVAATLSACQGPPDVAIALAMSRNARKAAAERPRDERLVVRDPGTGELLEDRRRIDYGPRGHVHDGPQRTWYPGGAPESSRTFRAGEPVGHWITWWRTGVLRSSYEFDPERATPMTWWHANGIVAAEGMARMGQRTGPWIHRWEHGALRSEGSYVAGLRDGPWTFYDEQGEWVERGRFRDGGRVGEWETRGGRGVTAPTGADGDLPVPVTSDPERTDPGNR